MSTTPRTVIALVVFALLLAACAGDGDSPANYTISIATSGPLAPNSYAGSYQFFHAGQRITRDLSNDAAYSVNFEADRLIFVRVHGNDPNHIYSLAISRNGAVIHESAAVPANQPLIHYVAPK